MKFGVKLPHSGPLADVKAIKRVAMEAEELGYDSVWVHDHISFDTDHIMFRASGLLEQTKGIDNDFYEALTTLTYVAGFTEKVKLGTSIIVLPLRDPRVLARQAITLQALSSGRLLLGLGIGGYDTEFEIMAVPYNKRASLTEEYLEALNALLPGGYVNFRGPTISFENAAYFPKVDPIPIWHGGGAVYNQETDQMELVMSAMRRVARWCTGWVPNGTHSPKLIAEGTQTIKELAREYGRGNLNLETVANLLMFLDDDNMARKKIRRSLEALGVSVERGVADQLVGSVETAARTVEAYQKAGATTIVMQCWAENLDSFVRMLRVFAQEVIPSFK